MSKAPAPQDLAIPIPVPLEAADGIMVDWYAPGQTKVVEIAGIQLAIRLVDRKGRRARIAVMVPAGARPSGNRRERSLRSM